MLILVVELKQFIVILYNKTDTMIIIIIVKSELSNVEAKFSPHTGILDIGSLHFFIILGIDKYTNINTTNLKKRELFIYISI